MKDRLRTVSRLRMPLTSVVRMVIISNDCGHPRAALFSGECTAGVSGVDGEFVVFVSVCR